MRVLPAIVVLLAAALAGTAAAEPCVLTYPLGGTVLRFDPSRYTTITAGHPNYQAAYDVNGQVLWDRLEQRVGYEAYQAPGLVGFVPSATGKNAFYFTGSAATLVVDGFFEEPRQLSNVYVQFNPVPANSRVEITVNGQRVVGLRYLIPRLVVSSPTGNGYYSNAVQLNVAWRGAHLMEVIGYSDRNGNRIFDGEPCFSTLMEDLTIPVEEKTWGSIKALFQE